MITFDTGWRVQADGHLQDMIPNVKRPKDFKSIKFRYTDVPVRVMSDDLKEITYCCIQKLSFKMLTEISTELKD